MVKKRIAADGFGQWTIKSGLEPPFEILKRMVTLRVHLDAVAEATRRYALCPARTGSAACLRPRLTSGGDR